MAYYKTNNTAVLAAWKSYQDQADELQKRGNQFAAMFPNAKAIFSTSIHSGRRFHGLAFNPPAPQPLWTKPDTNCGNSQRPRSSLPPSIKGDQRKALSAELKALRDKYKDGWPNGLADLDPFLEAMGLSSGALFFSRYRQVVTDGWIYIETSAKPGAAMIEILGSEFEAVDKH